MRIITGSARGTLLATLDGEATRPTAEKVKEAVFSALQFEIEGRRVLDLFAGSGQMALEALSRGAERATVIDSSRDAVNIIIENAKKTKLYDKCRISAIDYAAFLRSVSGNEKYDIILLDPPYDSDFIPKALAMIARGELLSEHGTVVCESRVPAARGRRPHTAELRREAELEQAKAFVFGGDESLAEYFSVRLNREYGTVRVTMLERWLETK